MSKRQMRSGSMVMYLAIGPEVVSAKQRGAAVQALFKWAKAHQRWVQCDGCLRLYELFEGDEATFCPGCGARVASVADLFALRKQCATRIDMAIADWNAARHCEDAAMRFNPDTAHEVVVAAGGIAWGDEPEGGGYQALKRIYALPAVVFTALGIK